MTEIRMNEIRMTKVRSARGVAGAVVPSVIAAVWASSAGGATPAWALCPNCLGQTRSMTPTLELLGAFLLVPFVISYVVYRTIRRHLGE